MTSDPFWKTIPLDEMTQEQWESLCDGCARCCLIKLEDEDTLELAYTEVVCKLLDLGTCRCTKYAERSRLVPDCIELTPDKIKDLQWMPSTCAYRVLAEGRDLAWWHPLVSGDPETIHQAGISVRNRAVPETQVAFDDLEDHIVSWPR